MEPKFCEDCGGKLKVEWEQKGFDKHTGKKIAATKYNLVCKGFLGCYTVYVLMNGTWERIL